MGNNKKHGYVILKERKRLKNLDKQDWNKCE